MRSRIVLLMALLATLAGGLFITETGSASAQSQTVGLVSYHSGKCLDVYNWSKAAGATIDQWTCGNHQANQEWTIESSNSSQSLVKNVNSGLCLYSDGAGLDVTQEPCDSGNQDQLWSTSNCAVNGGSDVCFRDAADGLLLDVSGNSQSNGALVDVWYANGGRNQIWYYRF